MERHVCTLITGASSGIGRETAIRLSRRYKLILHGRDATRLAETRHLCASADSHLEWVLDFQQADSIEPALREFIFEHGLAVQHIIHCAGMLKILPLRSIGLQH